MPDVTPTPKLGTVGRIICPLKGDPSDPTKPFDWGDDFRVVGYNPTVPITLQCESVARLRRFVPPSSDPSVVPGWVTVDDKAARFAHSIPLDWFHPKTAAKPQA